MSDFPQFVWAIAKGLLKAITTDIDVFLLLVAGLLLGRRGLGKALLAYVIMRRTDQYAGLFASKLDQIGLVMAKESRTDE